jgi:hypothetical protein
MVITHMLQDPDQEDLGIENIRLMSETMKTKLGHYIQTPLLEALAKVTRQCIPSKSKKKKRCPRRKGSRN